MVLVITMFFKHVNDVVETAHQCNIAVCYVLLLYFVFSCNDRQHSSMLPNDVCNYFILH